MIQTRMILFAALIALLSFSLPSCSGKGGGGAAAIPTVVVTENPDTGTGTDTGTTTTDNGSGTTTNTGGTTGTNTGSTGTTTTGGTTGTNTDSTGTTTNTGGTTGTDTGSTTNQNLVVILQPDATSGKLTINGEAIDPSQYNASNITVTSSSGTSIPFTVNNNGEIIITPSDGTIEGTYNVTITIDGRIYNVVVVVDANNIPTVISAVSYPAGTTMAVNLSQGVLNAGGLSLTITSSGIISGIISGYSTDSSIADIIIKDASGNILNWTIDSVTGDIVVPSGSTAPFTVDVYTKDGQHYTFQTDANGSVIGNITVSGRATAVDLEDGIASSGATTLTLSAESGSTWSLSSNVTILSVTAGASDAAVDVSALSVNSKNGDLMIEGSGTVAPAGPYTVKVSVGSDLYIIKTDAAGNITSIIPGNILLDLKDGAVVYNGAAIVTVGSQDSSGNWSISPSISKLTAVDANGAAVAITIDPITGDFVTPVTVSGSVTIKFDYLDSAGNTITYTIVVLNGSVTSYDAVVTNPSANFDYSTVTKVTVSLRVADAVTGLAIPQASISFIDANGTETWKGFTDSNGSSLFSASVSVINATTQIKVVHSGYNDVNESVAGASKVIAFGRNIVMTPISNTPAVVDTDGDGMADADDDYPNDANGAKKLTSTFTFAFEDLYEVGSSNKATFNTSSSDGNNDADFNDVVVRMTVVEKIDSQNKVRQIDITTKVLATLADYTDPFGVYINDGVNSSTAPTRYLLVRNPFDSAQKELTKTIVYTDGVSRATLGAAPYDPFIVPHADNSNYFILGSDGHYVRKVTSWAGTYYVPNEVHLASSTSVPGYNYTGPLTGTGYIKGFVNGVYNSNAKINQGFTWALMIPDGWDWPAVRVSIGIAYPKFVDWCNSGGTTNTDWYNYPDTAQVISN